MKTVSITPSVQSYSRDRHGNVQVILTEPTTHALGAFIWIGPLVFYITAIEDDGTHLQLRRAYVEGNAA